MSALLIGLGNPLRRDDGVGPAILRRLEALALPGVELRHHVADGAALMELWREAQRVYLFDAVASGGAAGTVHRLDARQRPLPSDFFHYSSHAFSLAEAVELGRVLGQLPPRLIVYGVEGRDYAPGEGLGAAVAQGVEQVVAAVAAELRRDAPE